MLMAAHSPDGVYMLTTGLGLRRLWLSALNQEAHVFQPLWTVSAKTHLRDPLPAAPLPLSAAGGGNPSGQPSGCPPGALHPQARVERENWAQSSRPWFPKAVARAGPELLVAQRWVLGRQTGGSHRNRKADRPRGGSVTSPRVTSSTPKRDPDLCVRARPQREPAVGVPPRARQPQRGQGTPPEGFLQVFWLTPRAPTARGFLFFRCLATSPLTPTLWLGRPEEGSPVTKGPSTQPSTIPPSTPPSVLSPLC